MVHIHFQFDSIGCVDTLSFDIVNPDPINIEIDSVQDQFVMR